MRVLLFFLFIATSFYGQVSEIISETWYLRSIRIDGDFNYLPLGETIELNFTDNSGEYLFETNGIENVMGGNVTFDVSNETLDLFDIVVTSTECLENNCPFEELYFYELITDEDLNSKTFSYEYFTFTNGNKLLRITDSNGNQARFFNYALQEPSSDFFQLWYLHSMDADLGDTEYISDFDPPISPSITINSDFSFTGVGSCNTFSGQFNYTDSPIYDIYLFATAFDKTNNSCEYHSGFESYYFSHFEEGYLLRYSYGNDFFDFEYAAGFTFNHYNYPVLSINDQDDKNIIVFPNPTTDIIKFENSEFIKEISIYSVLGEKLFSTITNSQDLNISFLNEGIYFIIFETDIGRDVQKIIKQ